MNSRRGTDALVLGGGVVGLAAAAAAVQRGLAAQLADRGPPPPAFDPSELDERVYALSPGSVRFLDGLGAWDAMAGSRVSAFVRMQVWGRHPGRALVFDAAELGVAQLGFIVEERLLRHALHACLPVGAMHWNSAAEALRTRDDGCCVDFENGEVRHAPVVVAADGARSRLREWAGIAADPVGYGQRSIVCHVETEHAHQDTAWQRFLDRGPLAFLPLSDGRSSIVWSTSSGHTAELMAMDDSAFCDALSIALDGPLGRVRSATPRRTFPLQRQQAEDYVAEGVALVGDAAHVIHPLAGQGVNLGLADVAALVEVLAEAKATGMPLHAVRTLKRYARGRRAENGEMMALTDALNRLYASREPLVENLRELGLGAVNALGPVKRRLAERAMGL